jgi:hypothetical protein
MKVLYTDSRKAMIEDAEIEGQREQEAEKMGWSIALPGDPALYWLSQEATDDDVKISRFGRHSRSSAIPL